MLVRSTALSNSEANLTAICPVKESATNIVSIGKASALTFLISQRVGFGFSIVLLSLGLFLMIGVSYNNVKSKT